MRFRWSWFAGDYKVLTTDYKNYAVVYSCTNILGLAKLEYVWILSRDIKLPSELMDKAESIIEERIPWYNMENLRLTKQGGTCKYLPVSAFEDDAELGYLIRQQQN